MPEQKKTKASGSETRQRQPHIDFRVTAAEKVEIEQAAKRAGLDVGSYVRAQCLAAPKVRAARRPQADIAALAKAVAELRRVGSNLNQIARVSNSEKRIMERELKAVLAYVVKAIDDIRAALGRKQIEQE